MPRSCISTFRSENRINRQIEDLHGRGGTGVYLFFILSGYLGFYSYNKRVNIKEYYLKRAFRIIPLYYSVIFLNMLMYGVFWNLTEYAKPVDNYKLGWLRYFLFLNQSIPAWDDFWKNLNATWTIPYFIMYYLLAPMLFKIISSYKKSVLFLAICWGIRHFWAWDWFEPIKGLYYFAVGILVYYAIVEKKENVTYIGIGLYTFLLILFDKINSGVMGYVNCFAIVFLASFYISTNYVGLMNNKFLVKLDEYSFTIYLGHAFVMELMNIIRKLVILNKIEVFLLFGTGTVIVCLLLQKCIVNPFIIFERKMLNYIVK